MEKSYDSLLKKVDSKELEKINELAERLDFLDVLILRKFYISGKDFPNNTQPYCFPLLYQEMKTNNKIKIGREALRKRLNNLVKLGLLEKIKNSNPSNYVPVKEKENFVKCVIAKFFLISGITKFF